MSQEAIVPPGSKKPSYTELYQQVLELQEKLSKQSKRKSKNDDQLLKIFNYQIHGKNTVYMVKLTYIIKTNKDDFFKEPSLENKICGLLTEEESEQVYLNLTQHLKKNINGYYELPPITDNISAVTVIILLAHCLGIQASKNGLIKPRNVTTTMFYWYLVENIRKSLPVEDELAQEIDYLDNFFLRLCYRHISDSSILISTTKKLLQILHHARSFINKQ